MHTYKFHRTLFQSVAMDNLYWNYLGCLKIYIYECYKRPIGVMPQESFLKKKKKDAGGGGPPLVGLVGQSLEVRGRRWGAVRAGLRSRAGASGGPRPTE